MRALFAKIMPFIFLGIMAVLFVIGLILFSYLLIFGAIVGLILFAIAWLKNFFSTKKHSAYPKVKETSGRTIDHDDL